MLEPDLYEAQDQLLGGRITVTPGPANITDWAAALASQPFPPGVGSVGDWQDRFVAEL